MSSGNIRRSQLIAPFGVGALSTLVDGTSIITCGLDHWFTETRDSEVDKDEYVIHDWRLENRLQVSEFRMPPDFRSDNSKAQLNRNRTIPTLRFPNWHFCQYCKALEDWKSTLFEKPTCNDPKHEDHKHKPTMVQVPFVVICTNGHLDDFPFRAWAHRQKNPTCQKKLRLFSLGSPGLNGQEVRCDCGKATRSLAAITHSRVDAQGHNRTSLSDNLSSDGEPFNCSGSMPWLGKFRRPCSEPLRGALRSAGNLYFPMVESSIYLPRENREIDRNLLELMRNPKFAISLSSLKALQHRLSPAEIADDIRKILNIPKITDQATDSKILQTFSEVVGPQANSGPAMDGDADLLTSEDEWRHPEFLRVREPSNDHELKIRKTELHRQLDGYLSRVRAVDAMRETRALRGFTRVHGEGVSLSAGKRLLRRQSLPAEHDWLPANVVLGEGIYFELNATRLREWEGRPEVESRATRLQKLSDRSQDKVQISGNLTPRLMLLHTLSHALINKLIFECGYSSASLRERLYVSSERGKEMAGVLLYTAAGDSEGTLGGLVRMARTESFHDVFSAAVESSRWCSTDPVCMDLGEKGQGPHSCNLAACHGCSLLPETACEHRNMFLDRAMIIGSFDQPSIGYFSDLT